MKKELLDSLIKLGNKNPKLRNDIKTIYSHLTKKIANSAPVMMAKLIVQTGYNPNPAHVFLMATPGGDPYLVISIPPNNTPRSISTLPLKDGRRSENILSNLKYNPNKSTLDYLDTIYDNLKEGSVLSKSIKLYFPPGAFDKFSSKDEEIKFLRGKLADLQKKYADLDPKLIKQFQIATQLSKVDPELAKVMSEEGDGKDDKVSVSKATMSAASLKPSQTTMVLAKSLGMALGMLESGKIGGDLGAIVSSDGFIMDGHHRWSAAILAGGKSAKVGGYKADLPGDQLVRALNILTKGYFKVNKGNPGKGALADYTPAKVKGMLEELVEKGVPGEFPKSAEDVQKILVDNFGSVEEGVKAISANAKFITTKTPSWAPDRVDMPVINPDQVPAAAKKLQQGDVIIPPKR